VSDENKIWTDAGSSGWIAEQDLLDAILRPFEDILLQGISFSAVTRALDIGCGTGGTTVALARRFGTKSISTGIDISQSMITAARTRAAEADVPVNFIVGDAQTYEFEPSSFDLMISRFGVMFFDDSVAAFANLHRAASNRATLRFVAWRGETENPFMTLAERAAAPLLPDLPPRKPNEPGQFAFADRNRVHGILHASGWREIAIHQIEVPCAMPENALARYVSRLGPVGRLLQEADDELRSRVLAAVLPAFDPYIQGDEVRFTAACWLVSARS
jgi:SAM-dependent methyltransferase